MLPLPRRTSPRIAAGSPQDSGLPAASASSARPHSGGPSASLGATSEPADTLSLRRLWPLPVISAEYRRASGGAAAVPSFAHRGLFFRTCPATGSASPCTAPLVPRCAAAGEVSPDPSRPRPDAAFGLDTAGAPPPPPRTPLRPPSYRWLLGGARQPPVQSRRLFWGAPVPPMPGGTLRAGLGLRVPGGAAPAAARRAARALARPPGRLRPRLSRACPARGFGVTASPPPVGMDARSRPRRLHAQAIPDAARRKRLAAAATAPAPRRLRRTDRRGASAAQVRSPAGPYAAAAGTGGASSAILTAHA